MQIGKKIVSVITTLTFLITPVVFFQNNAEAAETDEAFWRKMSSDYYYDQLNENDRKLYDRLDKACMDILLSDEDLDISYVEVDSEDLIMKMDDASRIVDMFNLSNPQYFFISSSSCGGNFITDDDGTVYLTTVWLIFESRYKIGSVRTETRAEIEKGIKEIIDTVSKGKRPEDKEYILHELIFNENSDDNPTIREANLYGALHGSAWYECVSALFTAVMNSVGIECTGVSGYQYTCNLIKLHGFYYIVVPSVNVSYRYYAYLYYNQNFCRSNEWLEDYLPELKNDSLENKKEYSYES